jgi:predicted transcriptional regulator
VIVRKGRIQYFTEPHGELVDSLIERGVHRNVAKVLVFLESTPEATTRKIQYRTNLQQPYVCDATKYLIDKGWVKSYHESSSKRGRPMKVYHLVKPIAEIIENIEKK